MQAERLDAYKAAPAAMRAVQQVQAYIQQSGLEKSLIELVKVRASPINGCAYCAPWGRNRAAALSSRRMARIITLHSARAGGSGLDRSSDPNHGNACTGLDLRRSAPALPG
jgi:alkylhydroperoxidase family enzyme